MTDNPKTKQLSFSVTTVTFWFLSIAVLLPMAIRAIPTQLENAFHGLVILVAGVTSIALILVRWDFTLRFPKYGLSLVAYGSGLVLSALAALFGLNSLCAIGLLLVLWAFFLSNLDRQNRSLGNLAWLVVPIVGLPLLSYVLPAFSTLESSMVTVADRILRVSQIPHILLGDSIRIPSQTLRISSLSKFYLGWHVIVLAAMTYSVLMRRNWPVTCFNLVSAICWWFVFHCATLIIESTGANASHSVILVCCVLASILLFLSTERAIRGIFAPVTDGTGDSPQANPLIVMWNWLADAGSVKHRKIPEINRYRPLAFLALIIVVLICQVGYMAGTFNIALDGPTPHDETQQSNVKRMD